jgi:hypothetical protein
MSKKNPRKKRPNPAFGLPGIEDLLATTAGNMAVTAALSGATLNERLLISAIIPMLLKILRTRSAEDLSKCVDGIYSDGMDIEIAPGIRMQREPGTANASDGAEPGAPEANKK